MWADVRPGKYFLSMEHHAREVLSGAALAFLLRAFGAGLAFALNVAIARLLGAEGAGLYFLALSLVVITSIVARMGLDNTVLRFVASAVSLGDWGRVKGVQVLSLKLAGSVSLCLALICFVSAPWIAQYLFDKSALTAPLRWMSLGIFTFSTMMLLAESLKGLKRVRDSMLVSGVLSPAFGLILIWPLTTLAGVAGASLTYVLATAVSAVVGVLFWRHALRSHSLSASPFPQRELWASSRPLWGMSVITQGVMPWAPLFLLGIWGSAEETGIFGAATRVAMLVSFCLTAVNTIVAPKFAELHTKGDLRALAMLARQTAHIVLLLSLPLFLFLTIAGDWVMSWFGPDFTRGGTALAILALGQAVNATTGSVGFLLIMAGHERSVRNSAIASSFVLVSGAVTLIPYYGMSGAAIASAASVATMNILNVYQVWVHEGIVVLPFWVKKDVSSED